MAEATNTVPNPIIVLYSFENCVQLLPRYPPSGSAMLAAKRNENRIDAMPISRRMVPWAKPSTKNAMRYRKMSRSIVSIPPRNAPRSTMLLCWRSPDDAGAAQA